MATKTYRHIGTYTGLAGPKRDIELKTYGQRVDLEPEEAARRISDGAPIITDEEFQACGHTEEHLKKFANPGSHRMAPPEFVEAKEKAWEALKKSRAALETPTMTEEDSDVH